MFRPCIRIARTGLWERFRWRDTGACPFGVSWRGELEVPTWAYRPLYMGDGASAIADVASPLHSPLLFRSLGTAPPVQWDAARAVPLQSSFERLTLTVYPPSGGQRSTATQGLAEDGVSEWGAPDAGWDLVVAMTVQDAPCRWSLRKALSAE